MKTNSKRMIVFFSVFLIIFCTPSFSIYAIDIRYNNMDLSNSVYSKILPLENIGSSINNNQTTRIMHNGFLTSGPENFGYYKIILSYNYVGEAQYSTERAIFGTIASILTGGFTILWIPIGKSRYELYGTLEIYDLEKKLVSKYTGSNIYEAFYSITDDKDETFRTEKLYRNIIYKILTDASREWEVINNKLIDVKYPKLPIGTVAHNAYNKLTDKIIKCTNLSCNAIAVISASGNTDTIAGNMQIENYFINNGYHIVDRSRIDLIMAELGLSNSVFVSNEDALRIGRLVSAKYLILVDVAGEGINKIMNFRVLSVETGNVIASYNSGFK